MAAICTVNAIACAPVVRVGPDSDATGWRADLGSLRHDASARESLPADPQPLWRAAAGRAVRGGPAIGTSVVAVGTSDRSIVLLDRASGVRIWRRHVPGTVAVGPLIAGAFVYAATQAVPDGRVLALRLKDGTTAWSVRTGGVSAPLALSDSAVIAAGDRGAVIALDQRTGTRLWERNLGRGARATPVVTPDGIAVATIGDTLYLLDAATGTIRARLATPGTIVGGPALDGKRLLAGTTAGHLLAITLPDLTVLWDRPVGDAVYGATALCGDTLYAITDSGTLWRVPLAAPERARSVALGVPATLGPIPLANGVLVAGVTGDVMLVDASTDSVRWHTRRRAPIDAPPVVKDRQLYLITGNGVVEAYR